MKNMDINGLEIRFTREKQKDDKGKCLILNNKKNSSNENVNATLKD